MNSRRMILLAVVMTIGALTSSAKAVTIERVSPVTQSLAWPLGVGGPFMARFGGLTWPYAWHEAQWYVDGALTYSDPLGGQTDESYIHWGAHTAGTHEIKVRARYDSAPWGVDVWTSYLTWTIEVSAHPPSASRVSPASPVTVYEGDTPAFTARGTDPLGELDIERVSWYLDGVHQGDFEFDPFDPFLGREHTWSHTFDTSGTYTVEAVFYDHYDCSASGEAVWTVEVQAHDPSGTIVSPSSPVTVYTGVPVTFTLAGSDPADDLWLCEVSLDGVLQVYANFSGAASGSTAAWIHTFNMPGTYRVAFVPVDAADNYGTAEVWTVVVKADPGQAGLTGVVIGRDAQGGAKGPLAGAKVDLTGPAAAGTATTDGQGQFTFAGLNPGTYAVNVSKMGYYAAPARNVAVAAGETKNEVFQLTPESPHPAAFDFSSPYGKHFIEGLPGVLSFSVVVAWNGSPGSVRFNVAGTWYTATLTDLGEGNAQASLTIPAPATISECSELMVEVTNGEGKKTTIPQEVYMHPCPAVIPMWLKQEPVWEQSGIQRYYMKDFSLNFWDAKFGKGDKFSTKAWFGGRNRLNFDPLAGTFSGSIGGYGKITLQLDAGNVEILGEGRLDLSGTLANAWAACEESTTSGWELSLSGKAGIGAPAVVVIGIVVSPVVPAAPATIDGLLKTPVVKDIVGALRLRLFLVGGGALSGEYKLGEPAQCLLGATSVSGAVTLGLEGQVLLKLWSAQAGVYAGATGTPEWQLCPDIEFKAVTLRAYWGVFASAWFFRYQEEWGLTIRIEPGGEPKVMAMSAIPGPYAAGDWQPIGDSCLRWGQMNLLAGEGRSGGRLHSLSAQDEISQETILVENVVPLASPVLLSGPSERLILFSLHDPNKPWHAATDIGTVSQVKDQPWVLDRIADDQAAEFGPSAVALESGMTLAAWERVLGDISDANEPGQVAPHVEIVAAWHDPITGLWSTPEQLTANGVVDHRPMPIALGATHGVLWIQNEGTAAIGDANSGDRLMFARWSGGAWDEPQTLWSAKKGLLDYAFVADSLGEGHVVFAVDEDGDPNTTADCELYLLWTANGAWQTATQLTSDFAEDVMATLVAPNGVPTCVWNADGVLVYSHLHDWNPRPVYREYTLANEAPSLDGVTMPGGAAIAYTVQGPNGVDIVASFYDASLDCWSLPRQLTNDEHAETSLSLTCDANELVIAYLKTQTLRTGMEIEIEGEMHQLENVPQPGRTDLYILRHALANDLAVVAGSMVLDPANPAPGTAATIRATIENRGDLPLQDVVAVFYDGDPSRGGVAIGDGQVIPGTLIAGGKQDVSVSWNVPQKQSPREIFVVVDPCLAVEDRDRSNNALAAPAVLPDLAIETCWSTEVSSTSMALTARIVNTGVIPAGAFDVSWRLGAPDGEQIGTSTIESLIAAGAYEATFMWDTTGYLEAGQHAQVFAVADPAQVVPESDETDNVASLAVFHPPAVSPGAP